MIVAIASDETKKKRVERAYVEEARRASLVIPYGDLVAHENPDFLLYADDRTIGLEVTELCRENPRAEGAMLARVADRAKERYNALAPNEPVEVSASFAPRMQERRLGVLVTGLVDFVRAHNRENKCFDWNEDDLPEGYCYIAIHSVQKHLAQWRTFAVFDTTLAPKELVAARIAEKLSRLREYRNAVHENWLLLVNDRFLGAGEVYVREDHARQWEFAFDFDKVLLFLRDPGGSGEVIEVRRTVGGAQVAPD